MKATPPIALLITALLCGALASCKKNPRGGGGNRPHEKPAETHESIAREAVGLMGEFVDSLADASDKASAKAAATKLDEVATKFETLAKRMDTIGLPEGDLKNKIAGMLKAQEEAQEKKVNALMGTLLSDEVIRSILGPALQAFSERIDKLTIIANWSRGTSGE